MDEVKSKPEVSVVSRPMITSGGRTFQVEGVESAKTMGLGSAWCVHRTAIWHCSHSKVSRRRKRRNKIGIIMEHYEGYVGKARLFILFCVRWEQNLRVLS